MRRGVQGHRERTKELNEFRKEIIMGDPRNLGCSKESPSSKSHSTWISEEAVTILGLMHNVFIQPTFTEHLLCT